MTTAVVLTGAGIARWASLEIRAEEYVAKDVRYGGADGKLDGVDKQRFIDSFRPFEGSGFFTPWGNDRPSYEQLERYVDER